MKKKKSKNDYLEVLFARQIADEGIVTPHREYRFHNGRGWKFDFAWPGVLTQGGFFHSLAFEVEGGSWIKGRHTTGFGFESDARKYGAANEHGWIVLRATGSMVKSGEAIRLLKRVILRPESLPIDYSGVCHALNTAEDSAPTADSTLTNRKSGTRSITRSVAKGKRAVSRPRTKGK